jgi:hypothetical protein
MQSLDDLVLLDIDDGLCLTALVGNVKLMEGGGIGTTVPLELFSRKQKRRDLRQAIELELEQARYEARLAAQRYESVDPDKRLVAAVSPAGQHGPSSVP